MWKLFSSTDTSESNATGDFAPIARLGVDGSAAAAAAVAGVLAEIDVRLASWQEDEPGGDDTPTP